MASVERIRGITEDAREHFVDAREDIDSRTHNVGASIAALRQLLYALEDVNDQRNPGKDHLNAALRTGSAAQESAKQGLGQLRNVTSGTTSNAARTMVNAAAKTHGEIIEGQARLEIADEALDDLVEPIAILRNAVEGVINQLLPESHDGENGAALRASLDETNRSILDYNATI